MQREVEKFHLEIAGGCVGTCKWSEPSLQSKNHRLESQERDLNGLSIWESLARRWLWQPRLKSHGKVLSQQSCLQTGLGSWCFFLGLHLSDHMHVIKTGSPFLCHFMLLKVVSLCPQDYWVRYVERYRALFTCVQGHEVPNSHRAPLGILPGALSTAHTAFEASFPDTPQRIQPTMTGLKFMVTHKRLHLREARGQLIYQA